MSTDWRSGYVSSSSSSAIVISGDNLGGLSKRCKLNFPYENNRFLRVGTDNGGNRINQASVSNFANIDRSTYSGVYFIT